MDKQVVLFSFEQGKICATLKSVKSPTAKLKAGKEPFCFADFLLVKKGESFVVTGVDVIDTFHDIALDYERYLAGCEILLFVQKVCNFNFAEKEIFYELVHTLNELCYGKASCLLIKTKFFLFMLKQNGVPLNLECCSVCEIPFRAKVFLCIDTGELTCEKCRKPFSVILSKSEIDLAKEIEITTYEDLSKLLFEEKKLEHFLAILAKNIQYRFA